MLHEEQEMTNKELQDILKQYPDDCEVRVFTTLTYSPYIALVKPGINPDFSEDWDEENLHPDVLWSMWGLDMEPEE